MEPKQAIERVLTATKLEDLLDISNVSKEFRSLMLLIHPDRCTEDGAVRASQRLSELKTLYERGRLYIDDSGEVRTNGYFIRFSESTNSTALLQSVVRYQELKKKNDTHFNRYMPIEMTVSTADTAEAKLEKRAVPIAGLTLPQEHVN